MLKIYGVPNSQPVRAVVWACLMKELPFEFIMTSQNRDAKRPGYLASVNPRGTIPAIDDEGTVLWESHAIPHLSVREARVGRSLARRPATARLGQPVPSTSTTATRGSW